MKTRGIFLATLLFSLLPESASASLNGQEDYSVTRIVAISNNENVGNGSWANYSGYLFSPRIIFSAGHMKDHEDGGNFYVSPPNQKISSGMKVVKAVKVLYPSTYATKIYRDDFSIVILEKPLTEISKAPLITPELLGQAISTKIPMKVTGFGAYQDVCLELKVTPPCQFGGDRTSLVPRSTEMIPWNASEVRSKYNQFNPDIADHLFLTTAYKYGPCGGDSGGSTTVLLDGISYYVGTVPSGFWNAYACGQSPGGPGDTLGYTAPVYKFLDLITEAEKYVAEHPYIPPKADPSPISQPTPSPTKSTEGYSFQYLTDLAKKWSKASRKTDTANKQCTSARDKGFVFKNGKLVSLGFSETMIRNDLKTKAGYAACLKGFKK